ncbi:MAG TPA: hypothetical protein VE261_03575 [Gaiellaceae bacterium]|nr:hypothetical protein [Gaiellaceae bacterium]
MGLFRRREPLHVRLAREGGLVAPEQDDRQLDPRPAWQEVAIHGVQRARDWDATVTAQAPDVEGDRATFVALPDGSLLVEDGPDGSLEPLAAAVETELKPPYRARAVRQGDTLWAVQARKLDVVKIVDAPEGDALDLTRTPDGAELRVDGERVFGSVRELEERGAREGRAFTIHAERLDGDLWEVKASAL